MTECPICMEIIEPKQGFMTTDCGHTFHAKCIMQNVAHNGFGCPYCRCKMAEEIDEPEESVYDEYSDDEEEDEEEEEVFSDHALRGFRFFTNNINNVPHNETDLQDEAEYENDGNTLYHLEEHPEIPTPAFVATKLMDQGVSYQDLVNIILLQHEEYNDDDVFTENVENLDNDIFGKIRIIVSNYNPPPISNNERETIPPPINEISFNNQDIIVPPKCPEIEFDAQPKISSMKRRLDSLN